MNVAPAATYEATFGAGIPGLVGTIQLAVLDNQGSTVETLSAAGIIETPIGSGIYAATRTSPALQGQYTLLWSLDGTTDPDQVFIDDLVVTHSAPQPGPPSGDSYGTIDEFAVNLHLARTPPTALQQDQMQRCLTTATGEINSEIDRDIDLSGWEVALATEVCYERAAEHWQQMTQPFGVIGLGELGPTITGRDSWQRHALKLAPLKQKVGLA